MSDGRNPTTTWRVEDLPPPTVVKLVEWKKPHGFYHKRIDGTWFTWRGKRGWLTVRSIDMVQALEAMP